VLPSQVSRVLVSIVITLGLALLINGLLFEGKTCLLYYILILCLIHAQPIVFQDLGGQVFLVDDEVRHKNGRVVVPGDDVLALVDGDGKSCIPNSHILDAVNLR
jgi:hypothetical protein